MQISLLNGSHSHTASHILKRKKKQPTTFLSEIKQTFTSINKTMEGGDSWIVTCAGTWGWSQWAACIWKA